MTASLFLHFFEICPIHIIVDTLLTSIDSGFIVTILTYFRVSPPLHGSSYRNLPMTPTSHIQTIPFFLFTRMFDNKIQKFLFLPFSVYPIGKYHIIKYISFEILTSMVVFQTFIQYCYLC